MLKEYLKQVFNPASAETQEEVVTMNTPNEQAPELADNTAELSAQLETVTATLTALQTNFAEVTAKLEAATAALAASEAATATLATQAAAKRLEARTEALTKAVGTDKLDERLAALEGLDDTAFNTIVSAMAASFEAESNTPLFKESGAAAETVVDEKPTHFNQYIKKEGN